MHTLLDARRTIQLAMISCDENWNKRGKTARKSGKMWKNYGVDQRKLIYSMCYQQQLLEYLATKQSNQKKAIIDAKVRRI